MKKALHINQQTKQPNLRDSNLELFRIIVMLLIIAHHYVVNSAVIDVISQNTLSSKSIFLFLFGAWGKIGINCFVLITGYFMCKSQITVKKFTKLLLEVEFYGIIIYLIFVLSGYESLSLTGIIKAVLPVTQVAQNFTGCFLIFYLCIPFLNVLVHNIDEKKHGLLICLVGFTYIFMGTIPKFTVTMNYVSWFICLFFIASYIRLYPKTIYEKTKLWGLLTLVFGALCCMSVIICLLLGKYAYIFVADSNTLLAVCLGISSFLFFKNFNIKPNTLINTIASSTFGVLLIHANSDTMRKWLWQTVLDVRGIYYADIRILICHAILSVLVIFIVCVIIDQIRIYTIEKIVLKVLIKR